MADIDPEWPHGLPLFSHIHPEDGGGEYPAETEAHAIFDIDTANLAMLLKVTDSVLCTDRKQPFMVRGRNEEKEQTYDTGRREQAFDLRGPRGGEYRLSLWRHWGEEGDGLADATGVYPQIRNKNDNELVTHLSHLATDAPIEDGPPDDLDSVDRIIHTTATGDRRYAATVTGTAAGGLLEVVSLEPSDTVGFGGHYTVDHAEVLAYRGDP